MLRRWCNSDLDPFAALNADPRVMEFFPECLTKEKSDALVEYAEKRFESHGFGLWAVEKVETSEFIGFIGLDIPSVPMPFGPCVEIGWRLAFDAWGRGYASEGARGVLKLAFESLALDEIVSFTVPHNRRSRSVMEKIGMRYYPQDDFAHPKLPPQHPLSRHVLYRARRT